jgi:hypothetical protein
MFVNGSEDVVNVKMKNVYVGLGMGEALLSLMLFVLVTLRFALNNSLVVLDFCLVLYQ